MPVELGVGVSRREVRTHPQGGSAAVLRAPECPINTKARGMAWASLRACLRRSGCPVVPLQRAWRPMATPCFMPQCLQCSTKVKKVRTF